MLNLLILLLVQRNPVTKQKIRATIPDYQDASDEAFDRMFERDKDELRAIGVPLEIAAIDRFFGDETGYRIRPDEFALPGINLTADEAAVVGLATRVWQHAGLAAATSDALAKLSAGGAEIDRSRLDLAAPGVAVSDPHFDVFWKASLDRVRLRFDYRRAGASQPTTRNLEPWGVVSSSGRWYVVGRDMDKDEPRLFRLSRVHGAVRRIGKGEAFEVPPGTDLRALTRSLTPPQATETGTVLVRSGTALALRRSATATETGVSGPDQRTEWDRITVTFPTAWALVDEVLQHGANAVVESPTSARELAMGRLREAIANTEDGAA
nr:WYL domain-containing protein [Nocardioides daedukensis]